MVSDDTTSGGTGRHTARKNAARELAARTGMPYTAALRQVAQAAEPRQPRNRWVLTDDVRAWFAGQGWRGAGYPNLYDWLDTEVKPTYECDWCAEPGDAREADSSISLVITAYDPDLSPFTGHMATHKYHAACKPSSIAWIHRADIPSGPQRISLPATMKPDVAGEFDLDVRPVLATHYEDQTKQAVLLVTARVVEDHDQGARPWLSELELHLNGEGFGHPDSLTISSGNDWSLRIVTGYPSSLAPQWIALRTGHAENGTPRHLVLCALDLPTEWVEVARRDGQVAVVLGPCTAHWDIAPVPGNLMDELDDLIDDSKTAAPDAAAECRCAALDADQIAEMVDAGAFVVGPVRVVDVGEES